MIRLDVYEAVRLNAYIARLDPQGSHCMPSSVRSDPVYLPTWERVSWRS